MSNAESSPRGLAPQEAHSIEDLKVERKRQIYRYLELGFHRQLGMSEEEYRGSFPEVMFQPEEYKGRFDRLVFVDPRIPVRKQHESAAIHGLVAGRTDLEIKHTIKDSVKVPNQPYGIWVRDARHYEDKSIQEAEEAFVEDEVGATLAEVTALFVQNPEVFKGYAVEAAGSYRENSSEKIPFVESFRNGRRTRHPHRFGFHRPGSKMGNGGVLSRGEEVITTPDTSSSVDSYRLRRLLW